MNNAITVVTLSDRLHPALTPAESLVALPNVTFQEIPSASQFSAFAECTERGIKILASEGRKHFARSVTRFPERTIISKFWM